MSYNPYAPATNAPTAPYLSYRSLPPSPLVVTGGLGTPPDIPTKLPNTDGSYTNSYSLNPSLADVMVAFSPPSSRRYAQPATNPPVPHLRIKLSSPNLPWRIEVPASNRTFVTVLDVWHALHENLYIQLTANEQLQYTSADMRGIYCQRLQQSPGYFSYPCRIDVLCGRVRARFGTIREGRSGPEIAVEFY